jgi:hypothetical protein
MAILAVINHGQPKILGILHRASHEVGVVDGLAVIADGDDAGAPHLSNLCQLRAF